MNDVTSQIVLAVKEEPNISVPHGYQLWEVKEEVLPDLKFEEGEEKYQIQLEPLSDFKASSDDTSIQETNQDVRSKVLEGSTTSQDVRQKSLKTDYLTRTHKDKKPHNCEFCGKFFENNSRLAEHTKIHKNEKSYFSNMRKKSFNTQRTHSPYVKPGEKRKFLSTTKQIDEIIKIQ